MNYQAYDELRGGNPQWYAIQTKYREEHRASVNLKAWDVMTFVPRLKERRHNKFTGKNSYAAMPLFPRYIFGRFPLSMLAKVRFTRGVQSVVSFSRHIVPVEDEVISLIQSRVMEDGFIRIGEELKAGDKVMIKDGSLRELLGIFEREVEDNDRVMILLSTLSYQARVIIDREMVSKITEPVIGA